MSYHIDIQHACNETLPVTDETLDHWVTSTLQLHHESAEITLRLVDAEEISDLNHIYRKKNKATNVLAFPAAHPAHVELEFPLLGDVIICPIVLKQESENLETPLIAHWAHIVIHGVLHLLGYDHVKDDDAIKMQSVEIQLLAELGFDNPYKTEAN
jgi:probable rRNA maturation factor